MLTRRLAGACPRVPAPWHGLGVAGLIACLCLAVGEIAPSLFPVHVTLVATDSQVDLAVDGEQHVVPSQISGQWGNLELQQPGPAERLYQIDGSDTTSTDDLDVAEVRAWELSPLYRLDAWLRDEGSFSRWDNVRLYDASGHLLAEGPSAVAATDLPASFRLEADLQHPEAAAFVWLVAASDSREGLELNSDTRDAKWDVDQNGQLSALPRWFFPEQPLPFLADLLQLGGRSIAAAYALALVACGLGWLLSRAPRSVVSPRWAVVRLLGASPALVLPVWLGAAAAVTIVLYQQIPHVLDAVSYDFQAGVFASGHPWLTPPDLVDAFRGPFQIVQDGRWYSQYPPGAPAVYALGQLLSVSWLIGPLAGLVLLGTTAWTAARLFGRCVGVAVLVLGALSPFLLFQAGSFLSHPVAGAFLAVALAAIAAGTTSFKGRVHAWFAVAGAALGCAFLTREAASVLFALPLLVWLVAQRRWKGLAVVVAAGLPFAALYLAYNAALTGSPWLLPRMIFAPNDTFGFGDGMGFHGRHTLAAGLANANEELTLLQFDLFGWPPLFALGVLALPLILGRPRAMDLLLFLGAALFPLAYLAYFYHGIVLGPRYYFEALPWLLLLAGRALQRVSGLVQRFGAALGAARLAATLPIAALCLNTVAFYLPHAWVRREDYTAITGAPGLTLSFVQETALGPRLVGVQEPALVIVPSTSLYLDGVAALNCADLGAPAILRCPALFALATTPADEQQVVDRYGSGRSVYDIVVDGNDVTLRAHP